MSSEKDVYSLIPHNQGGKDVYALQDQHSSTADIANTPIWQQLNRIAAQELPLYLNHTPLNISRLPNTANAQISAEQEKKRQQLNENLRSTISTPRTSFRDAGTFTLMPIEQVTQGLHSRYPDAGFNVPKTDEQREKERNLEQIKLESDLIEVSKRRQAYYQELEKVKSEEAPEQKTEESIEKVEPENTEAQLTEEKKDTPEMVQTEQSQEESKPEESTREQLKEAYEKSQKIALSSWLQYNEKRLRNYLDTALRKLHPDDPVARVRAEEDYWTRLVRISEDETFNKDAQGKIGQILTIAKEVYSKPGIKGHSADLLYKSVVSIVEEIADGRVLDATSKMVEGGKVIEDKSLRDKTLSDIDYKLKAQVKVVKLEATDKTVEIFPENMNPHKCTVTEVYVPGIYPRLTASEKVTEAYDTALAEVKCRVPGTMEDAMVKEAPVVEETIKDPYEKTIRAFETAKASYEYAMKMYSPAVQEHYKEQYEEHQRAVLQAWVEKNKDDLRNGIGVLVETLPVQGDENKTLVNEIWGTLSTDFWKDKKTVEAAQQVAFEIYPKVVMIRLQEDLPDIVQDASEGVWAMVKKELEYVTGGKIVADELYGRNLAAIEANGIPIKMQNHVYTPDHKPAPPGRCKVIQVVEPGIVKGDSRSALPFEEIPPVVECKYREEDMPSEELGEYQDEFLDARDNFVDTVDATDDNTYHIWSKKRLDELMVTRAKPFDTEHIHSSIEYILHKYDEFLDGEADGHYNYFEYNGLLMYAPAIEMELHELMSDDRLQESVDSVVEDMTSGDSHLNRFNSYAAIDIIHSFGLDGLLDRDQKPTGEMIAASIIVDNHYAELQAQLLQKIEEYFPKSALAYDKVFGTMDQRTANNVLLFFNERAKEVEEEFLDVGDVDEVTPLPVLLKYAYARAQASTQIEEDAKDYFRLPDDITSDEILAAVSVQESVQLSRLHLIHTLQKEIKKREMSGMSASF